MRQSVLIRTGISLTIAASVVAWVSSGRAPADSRTGESADQTGMRDTHERLHPVLWMQTSAEYRTLARSTYTAAACSLSCALANPDWSAAVEQGGDFQHLPAAATVEKAGPRRP